MASPFAVPHAARPEGTRPNPDCQVCSDFQVDVERLTIQLAKAHQLLRTLRRMAPKSIKPDTMDDEPAELMCLGYATMLAEVQMRIDLYAQSARVKL